MKPSTPNLDRWRYIIVVAKFMVHFLHPGLVKSLSVLVPSLVIQLDIEYSTAFIFVTLETVISSWLKTLHDTVDFVKAERVFTFILLPCQALFDISYCGWVVFLFSYGISEELSNDEAVFLVMMGSIGGITGRLFVIAILYRFPLASPQPLALNYLIASTSILAYPINSSPTYLSICSLFAGFGFYSASSTLYGAISVNVEKENFPKAIASSLLVSGTSYLISGLITASLPHATLEPSYDRGNLAGNQAKLAKNNNNIASYLYDVFGSYRVTFRILGILLAAISLPILIYICKSSQHKKTSKGG
nr:uncharacterized protein LOC129267608 [Lytechinus pictus]